MSTQSFMLGHDGIDCAVHVRAQSLTEVAAVELHDVDYHVPQDVDSRVEHGFLDFAITSRAGEPMAVYPEFRGHAPHRVGDLLFVPANVRLHSMWRSGAQRSVCVRFNDDAGHLDRDWTVSELNAGLDVRNGFVRDAMMRLARELQEPGFASPLMVETLCIQLAILMRRHFDAAVGAIGETRALRLGIDQLRRVEDMIDCVGPTPSISVLARECGVSTRHFCRLFRLTTGHSLTEFAIERRIERARTLLLDPRKPIKQIAWECGFQTPAAFSAAFRRATGQQPSVYRDAVIH